MAQVTPGVVTRQDRVLQVFLESIQRAGGARHMIEHHTLGWLPDLLTASCLVVLQEEEHMTPEAIQAELGIGRETIENILSTGEEPPADVDALPERGEAREDAAARLCRAAYREARSEDVRIS